MFRMFGCIVLVVAAMTLWWAPSTLAQNTPATFIVQIRAGACDEPGDGLAQLGDLTLTETGSIGAPDAAAAASSYSVAPVSLESLTATATAIFVLDAASNRLVACGEVGGVIGNDGALAIGLRPAGESGLSGIAYLSPSVSNPAQTGVSTFLAATGAAGEPESSEAPVMDAGAYSSMISSQLTVLVGSLQRIDALFDNARPGERDWVSQVGAELFLWKLLHRIAQDVNPPAAYASFDQNYREALALLDSAASDILQALESGDNASLESAGTKIQDAVTALRNLQSTQQSATPIAGTPTS